MSGTNKSVLFVCLGNICRSPIAEAVLLHLLKERGQSDKWRVDSAAIGPWHIGKPPERRATKTLQDNNVEYSHKARQITNDDFNTFDYIFGMDEENMSDLKRLSPKGSTACVQLLGSYDPEGDIIIEDPYYQKGDKGFIKCYQQCVRCCKAFLDSLK
ncbi:hypothetical protein AAG570_011251 [Ranatra chinensis]|uniref:Low molecular weight phosphotyrosine protein phosphatase n=1 Tax=Ranatra chinensis TaxID=642074 RepID=A0ABD0Z2B3_9HEMI